MKFYWDFAREILIALEDHPKSVVNGLDEIRETMSVDIDEHGSDGQDGEFSGGDFAYHCMMLCEAGFILIIPPPTFDELNPYLRLALTYKGHEYLASIRENG